MSTTPQGFIVLNYVKGGLGNQLFQHVFARSLAKRFNAELMIDISYFEKDPYGFKPGILKLLPEVRTSTLFDMAGPGTYLLKDSQIRAIEQLQCLPPDIRVLVLEGYWQSEGYFDADIARETYSQLCEQAPAVVAPELICRLNSCPHPIAVHLRRRDYGHMGLCKNSYYLACIAHMLKNTPGSELFIFSDEPNYAQHLMKKCGLAYTLVSSGSDLGDLYLMSLCRDFVISNSSYSWWAAWFGETNGGKICCPKEWVTIDDTPSPCPSRWLQIDDAINPFKIDDVEVSGMVNQLQRQNNMGNNVQS